MFYLAEIFRGSIFSDPERVTLRRQRWERGGRPADGGGSCVCVAGELGYIDVLQQRTGSLKSKVFFVN